MASAPNINARCEIDLSPGTRIVPISGPEACATVGEAGESKEAEWAITKDPRKAERVVAVKRASAHMLEPGGETP